MARQSSGTRSFPQVIQWCQVQGCPPQLRFQKQGGYQAGSEPALAILDIGLYWIKYLDAAGHLAYMGPIPLTFWWERACWGGLLRVVGEVVDGGCGGW
jgi:hypothetical protein